MEELLTIDELTSYLKVKKSAIYDMVYHKKIPYTKIGQRLRFRKDLIDAWIENYTSVPLKVKILYNIASTTHRVGDEESK